MTKTVRNKAELNELMVTMIITMMMMVMVMMMVIVILNFLNANDDKTKGDNDDDNDESPFYIFSLILIRLYFRICLKMWRGMSVERFSHLDPSDLVFTPEVIVH